MKRYNERIHRYIKKIIREELEDEKTINLSSEIQKLDKIVSDLNEISITVGKSFGGFATLLNKYSREIEKVKKKLEEQTA